MAMTAAGVQLVVQQADRHGHQSATYFGNRWGHFEHEDLTTDFEIVP
jgi:hypothetical protein